MCFLLMLTCVLLVIDQIAFNSFPTLKLTLPKLELSTSSLLISGEEDVSFSTNDDINLEGGHEVMNGYSTIFH